MPTINPKNRFFKIPYEDLKIHYQKEATLGFDGSIFIDQKYFKQQAKHTAEIEHSFRYVQSICFLKIRSFRDLKSYLKKLYFCYFHYKSWKNKKIFNNPNVVKILFFETAYDNMYHFIFQYYPSLLALIDFCKKKSLDYYIVMPPKCNRGILGYKRFYNGFIDEIVKLEKIDRRKMLYLNYINYNVRNIYYTNYPIDNPEIILPAIRKIQNFFYDYNFQTHYERIYISRKKATRRFLINEDEIKKILENEYGFHTIYMEDHNLYQKINTMIRARIVISVDGTSLVNGYFSIQNNAKMIALRVYDMTEWGPIISAMFSNLEYLPIIADIENKRENDFYKNLWTESDLYLCPQYLRKKMKEYGISKLSHK